MAWRAERWGAVAQGVWGAVFETWRRLGGARREPKGLTPEGVSYIRTRPLLRGGLRAVAKYVCRARCIVPLREKLYGWRRGCKILYVW
jgi:hypothetical protein